MAGSKRSRVTAALGGVGLVVGLLSACSDSEPRSQPPTSAPTSSETTETPPSSEPSPTPTPPPLPAQAKEDNKAGAKAFVAWYLDAVVYSANTGDVALLRQFSEECSGCEDYASFFEKVYGNGGYLRGVRWTPVSWAITQGDTTTRVLVAIRAAKATFRQSAGGDIKVNEAYDDAFVFELSRRDSMWGVSGLRSGEPS